VASSVDTLAATARSHESLRRAFLTTVSSKVGAVTCQLIPRTRDRAFNTNPRARCIAKRLLETRVGDKE